MFSRLFFGSLLHQFPIVFFCANFRIQLFVPIFYCTFLYHFFLNVFCIILLFASFVSFFGSSFLYQLFSLRIFVSIRILTFCIIFNFIFKMLPTISIKSLQLTTALNTNWADGSNLSINSLPIFSKSA